MNAEMLYRFCVREKPSARFHPSHLAAFITRHFLTEAAARARFDVIERLEHTAISPDALLQKLASNGT